MTLEQSLPTDLVTDDTERRRLEEEEREVPTGEETVGCTNLPMMMTGDCGLRCCLAATADIVDEVHEAARILTNIVFLLLGLGLAMVQLLE